MSAIATALNSAIDVKISRGQKAAETRRKNEASKLAQMTAEAKTNIEAIEAISNRARLEEARNAEVVASKEEVAAILSAPLENSSALLEELHNAIVSDFSSDERVRKAFIAAGKDQTDVIRQFYASRLVAVGACATLERAKRVVMPTKEGGLKACPKAGVEVTDNHMTHKEELAFGAARGYLTQKRKQWGIPTTSKQGGDQTKKSAGEATPMDIEKVPPLPSRKGIETDEELGAYMLGAAQSLYAMCLKNDKHDALTTDLGAEIMGACADFEAAIKEVLAAHKGE